MKCVTKLFRAFTLTTVVFSGMTAMTRGDEASWTKETVVYKTVEATKIEADVYRRNGSAARPVVVWIHGGALINGDRESVPSGLAELCRSNNYVLISIDYRLAPQVRLPAIIDDVKAAFAWIHDKGRGEYSLDTSRLLVAGGSAGGYLTMMTGICIEPRPKALLAYWGYGDVDGPWYTQPSEHYRKQPLLTEQEALSAVGTVTRTSGRGQERGKYYLYLRQNGLWTKAVTGFDPVNERAKLDPFCPVRNITPQYPPILMVHGTADDDVPYQESADMAAALKAKGVWHELVTVVNGGHGLGGANKEAIENAHARALEFVHDQLE